MNVEETTASAFSAEQYWWLCSGGIAAIGIAIGYIAMIPLFAHVGVQPKGGEAWFQYLQGKAAIWWTILITCFLTDLLYILLARH